VGHLVCTEIATVLYN